jgi:quinol monooxygenase YgiN
MSVLIAFVREAQPGRVAEVRQALQQYADAATHDYKGIRTYQVLQGRAQSNLYVDLVEWDSRRSFERAREALRAAAEPLQPLFLRSAHVRAYEPVEIVRLHRREPQAVGVGLARVRVGHEQEFTNEILDWMHTRFRERPGLLAVGLYRAHDEPQQFLIRHAWDSEEQLAEHRSWIARDIFPRTGQWVERRELLALLMRWHYRQTPLSSGEAV